MRDDLTAAQALQVHRLPDQIDLAQRRMRQLNSTPQGKRNAYWWRRWDAAVAKRDRLLARAADFGLRDLAERGRAS